MYVLYVKALYDVGYLGLQSDFILAVLYLCVL